MTSSPNNSNSTFKPLVSTAPGRLCLFGEHSDYLNLPVIAAALPLQCTIHVTPTPSSRVLCIQMPFNKEWACDLDNLPPSPLANGDLDFALSAIHEVKRAGWKLQCGAKCVSTTDIPLQSGCSSSSAFCVAWIQALARLAGKSTLTKLELAQMAHCAEVTHYGNPGGTMDHVTSALGGILRIGPEMWHVEPLSPAKMDGVWVLADSGEPKDTMKHLRRCKYDRLNLHAKLGNDWDSTDTTTLTPDEVVLLKATRTNRNTEQQAAVQWRTAAVNGQELGALMLQHHEALRDGLRLSTNRLEDMRQGAMESGAWGFKVVGSGGGGCAVAWCPTQQAEKVAKAMETAGAVQTWQITKPFHGAMIQETTEE